MVIDFCGGEPSEAVIAGDPAPKEVIIDYPVSELPRLAGIKLSQAEIRRTLERLGFFVAGISVRMVLECRGPICLPKLVSRRFFGHPENFVIIPFLAHDRWEKTARKGFEAGRR